jgi:hypothetical protein
MSKRGNIYIKQASSDCNSDLVNYLCKNVENIKKVFIIKINIVPDDELSKFKKFGGLPILLLENMNIMGTSKIINLINSELGKANNSMGKFDNDIIKSYMIDIQKEGEDEEEDLDSKIKVKLDRYNDIKHKPQQPGKPPKPDPSKPKKKNNAEVNYDKSSMNMTNIIDGYDGNDKEMIDLWGSNSSEETWSETI